MDGEGLPIESGSLPQGKDAEASAKADPLKSEPRKVSKCSQAWMLPDLICRTTSLGSRPPSAANYRVCLMINFKRVRPMTFKRRHTPSRQTLFDTSCYG
jgi:hypothetical protein